ncbi:hypothetical protein Dda_0147 [Drechslerella dactyloides]|uniref:Uncharacterized protein n=1 Tax=Drechslerella dactyloides TaxID=74499 RepID=A0AAD6NNZ4_DREDA|nr:hypothetical protein Dda_0147 [Drechslerella dactyloides]
MHLEDFKADWGYNLLELERIAETRPEDQDVAIMMKWLRFALHESPKVAFQLEKIIDILTDMARHVWGNALEPLRGPVGSRIEIRCRELTSEWTSLTRRWESAAEDLLEVSVHYKYIALERTEVEFQNLVASRKEIGRITAASRSESKRRVIVEATRGTLQELDNFIKSLAACFCFIDDAEKLRQEKLTEHKQGLRQRRRNHTGSSNSRPRDSAKGNDQSSASSPTKIGATAQAAVNLSFPSFFYPTPVAVSTLQKIIESRDTIWFPVFILTVASGIFTGMAFFNPDNSLFSALSQMLRSYASLWCLLIPLFRDRTLPVWPTRGWLYGSVATAASLGVVGVAFCAVDGSWSGLITSVGDFSALAATVLLAMGVVNSAAAHAP